MESPDIIDMLELTDANPNYYTIDEDDIVEALYGLLDGIVPNNIELVDELLNVLSSDFNIWVSLEQLVYQLQTDQNFRDNYIRDIQTYMRMNNLMNRNPVIDRQMDDILMKMDSM